MAVQERYPDCRGCEAPCCRRQFMEDEDGFFTLKDIRAIYRPVGIDVRIVGWAHHPKGHVALGADESRQLLGRVHVREGPQLGIHGA